jgi:hypothetical protein
MAYTSIVMCDNAVDRDVDNAFRQFGEPYRDIREIAIDDYFLEMIFTRFPSPSTVCRISGEVISEFYYPRPTTDGTYDGEIVNGWIWSQKFIRQPVPGHWIKEWIGPGDFMPEPWYMELRPNDGIYVYHKDLDDREFYHPWGAFRPCETPERKIYDFKTSSAMPSFYTSRYTWNADTCTFHFYNAVLIKNIDPMFVAAFPNTNMTEYGPGKIYEIYIFSEEVDTETPQISIERGNVVDPISLQGYIDNLLKNHLIVNGHAANNIGFNHVSQYFLDIDEILQDPTKEFNITQYSANHNIVTKPDLTYLLKSVIQQWLWKEMDLIKCAESIVYKPLILGNTKDVILYYLDNEKNWKEKVKYVEISPGVDSATIYERPDPQEIISESQRYVNDHANMIKMKKHIMEWPTTEWNDDATFTMGDLPPFIRPDDWKIFKGNNAKKNKKPYRNHVKDWLHIYSMWFLIDEGYVNMPYYDPWPDSYANKILKVNGGYDPVKGFNQCQEYLDSLFMEIYCQNKDYGNPEINEGIVSYFEYENGYKQEMQAVITALITYGYFSMNWHENFETGYIPNIYAPWNQIYSSFKQKFWDPDDIFKDIAKVPDIDSALGPENFLVESITFTGNLTREGQRALEWGKNPWNVADEGMLWPKDSPASMKNLWPKFTGTIRQPYTITDTNRWQTNPIKNNIGGWESWNENIRRVNGSKEKFTYDIRNPFAAPSILHAFESLMRQQIYDFIFVPNNEDFIKKLTDGGPNNQIWPILDDYGNKVTTPRGANDPYKYKYVEDPCYIGQEKAPVFDRDDEIIYETYSAPPAPTSQGITGEVRNGWTWEIDQQPDMPTDPGNEGQVINGWKFQTTKINREKVKMWFWIGPYPGHWTQLTGTSSQPSGRGTEGEVKDGWACIAKAPTGMPATPGTIDGEVRNNWKWRQGSRPSMPSTDGTAAGEMNNGWKWELTPAPPHWTWVGPYPGVWEFIGTFPQYWKWIGVLIGPKMMYVSYVIKVYHSRPISYVYLAQKELGITDEQLIERFKKGKRPVNLANEPGLYTRFLNRYKTYPSKLGPASYWQSFLDPTYVDPDPTKPDTSKYVWSYLISSGIEALLNEDFHGILLCLVNDKIDRWVLNAIKDYDLALKMNMPWKAQLPDSFTI